MPCTQCLEIAWRTMAQHLHDRILEDKSISSVMRSVCIDGRWYIVSIEEDLGG